MSVNGVSEEAKRDYELGCECWEHGDGDGSFEHWNRAAELGYAPAQIALANGFLMASRKVDDPLRVFSAQNLAARWFRKAAEQGDAAAQYRLWELLSAGRGAKQDVRAAARWLGKAAFQGHPEAARALAKKVLRNRR